MFILYALPIGLLLGALMGGHFGGLGQIRFRWAALAVLGFAFQVVLFSEPVAARVGAAGPLLYVASTAVVLVAVLRNLSIPGMAVVALGAGSNLAAIVANGGYMPTGATAAAEFGRGIQTAYSNSRIVDAPALELLTDVIALPRWLPFANIVSVGDILIGLGVAIVIVAAMRARPAALIRDDGGASGPVQSGNSPI
jgi:hypothetical protein